MQTEPEDRKYSLVELVGDHFTGPRGRLSLKFWVLSREARIGEALRLHRNQNAVFTPVADDEENAVVSVHGRRHVKHVATDGCERNRCSDRAPGALTLILRVILLLACTAVPRYHVKSK